MSPVWLTATVAEQPSLTIDPYAAVEIGGNLHLVGYVIENRKGRVSTAIKTFDPETRRVTTESGRLYQLGQFGADADGLYILSRLGITSPTLIELTS